MKRTIPQLISVLAITIGVTLFAATLLTLDRQQTFAEARALGLALPLILIPSLGWHLLRAAGWYVCFPRDQRPSYWRVFRVRLAADGVAYFTIRGVASEPLRVVLLLGRVPATVSAAASVLERTAMGIMSVVGVGVFAAFAVSSDMLPRGWQRGFQLIAILAGVVLALTVIFLTRTGHYFGPMFERIHRRTGWRWTGGKTVHFITTVEDLFLTLARTDRGRIRTLVLLSIACYALMTLEVCIVFWMIGESMTLWMGTIVETFTRSVSVLGGVIPGNLGALEASNVAVVKALGLAGGGSLALARRVRSLLWATAGLALYPRDTMKSR
ncbi:MAG: lysylphosphatidylglycerol synthase transmembrane domain-containing protein [Vicinamibacterales bacterium]